VNELLLALPLESVAVQVTVVVAIGNVEPDAGLHVTGSAPSKSSIAVGDGNVTTLPCGEVASI
jgi:Ca2+/Na+ antiporter